MSRIIDLSLPLKPHFRWKFSVQKVYELNKGDTFQFSVVEVDAHSFTHIDAPLHFIRGGKSIDEVPLSQLVGEAAVIDLSDIKPKEAITSRDLNERGKHVKEGDIVLIKTEWEKRFSWESEEYWSEAPYLTKDAAEWFIGHKVKAIGCDFPQEYAIRELGRKVLKVEEFPVHQILLGNNILNIEYLTNLSEVKKERVKIIALPLKMVGCEGAPARVIAIED